MGDDSHARSSDRSLSEWLLYAHVHTNPSIFETAPFYTNRPFVHSKPLNQLTETGVFFELLSSVKGHVYTNPGKKNTGVSKNCVRVDGGLTCFTSDKQNNFFLAFLQVIAYKSS